MGKLPCTSFTGSPDWGNSDLYCTMSYEVLEDEDFKDPEGGKELFQDDLVGKELEMHWGKGVGWANDMSFLSVV